MHMKTIALAILCTTLACSAQTRAAPTKVELLTDQPDEWFASDEGKKTLDVILSYQNPNGGWNKAYKLDVPRAKPVKETEVSTIDNGATHSEIRVLARAYRVTKDERYADATRKGLKFFLDSQYANGGWPQRFPLENNYGRHITYNDDAMLGVMRVLRDAAEASPDFAWLSEEDRSRAKVSLEEAIDCVLATQIKIDGKPTVWCQQHDEVTLAPASARSYELPSFCSTESAGLTLFLMEMKNPDDRIKAAVHGAAEWFGKHKIEGKRVERLEGPQYELGKQRNLVDDPNAKPIWARFYDLDTGKPYFCDRDGVKLDSFEKLGHERRVNYAWFNDRGNRVLEQYAEWCRQP